MKFLVPAHLTIPVAGRLRLLRLYAAAGYIDKQAWMRPLWCLVLSIQFVDNAIGLMRRTGSYLIHALTSWKMQVQVGGLNYYFTVMGA